QTIADAFAGVMGAAQIPLMDAVFFGLSDAVPGVEDQHIVDAPVLQRERRQLDNIDELAGLDEHVLIRLDVGGSKLFDRIAHGNGNTYANDAVAVKTPHFVAVSTPRCCRPHPKMLPKPPQDVADSAVSLCDGAVFRA